MHRINPGAGLTMIPLASATVLDGSTSTVNLPPLRVLTVSFMTLLGALAATSKGYRPRGLVRIRQLNQSKNERLSARPLNCRTSTRKPLPVLSNNSTRPSQVRQSKNKGSRLQDGINGARSTIIPAGGQHCVKGKEKEERTTRRRRWSRRSLWTPSWRRRRCGSSCDTTSSTNENENMFSSRCRLLR